MRYHGIMYPDQSNQPLPPNQNQYDFILNHQKRTPVDWLSSAGLPIRIGIVAGGLLGLLLLFVIFSSLIGSGNDSSSQLTDIAQRQAELIRISSSVPNAAAPTIQNLAASVKLTMSSDQHTLVSLLAQNNKAIDEKTLAARRSQTTDTQLTHAQQDGTYDTALTSVIEQQLSVYIQIVQQAFTASHSHSERSILQADYAHGQLLVDVGNQQR